MTHESDLPALVEEPIANPGLPEHQWRPTDVDPAAERRAERQVATLFGLAMLCAILFIVSYFAFKIGDDPSTFLYFRTSNLALGACLGGAFLFIGIGVIQWARKLMGDHEIVEMRHPAASTDEDRETTLAMVAQGVDEAGIGRRPLIRNTLLGAVGLSGLAPLVLLKDLGPTDIEVLEHTIWDTGMRVVRDVAGTPILASALGLGDLVNAQPEKIFQTDDAGDPLVAETDLQVAKAKSSVIVLRMDPADIKPVAGRDDWSIDGIVCYSKICTHVGCPISLNERTTSHLLCPCHQSTFDLTDGGRVIFGPAARALPQLPLAVDSEGYLIAQSDFHEPVGPSYWERDSQ